MMCAKSCYIRRVITELDCMLYHDVISWYHPYTLSLVRARLGGEASSPESWPLCNMGYLPKTYLKLKSHKISFVDNICLGCPIAYNFDRARQWYCRALSKTSIRLDYWHGCDEQNEISRDLSFKMSFGWISYFAQHPVDFVCVWGVLTGWGLNWFLFHLITCDRFNPILLVPSVEFSPFSF